MIERRRALQKKTDKFFDKIVKKDYHNELEKVLEKKAFDENTKSLLLSILYKIETAYKDYEKVKPGVEDKEQFMQSFIDNIKHNCEDIKIIKLNSKEAEMLGNKTFLVEKSKKRIICYPMERKLLYCIGKISKKEKIVKDHYYIIDKTLSDLINVGNCINMVEPMRDFNGYSWTTIPQEIESIFHNIVYQNMRILVGYQFLNNWVDNHEFILDYMEEFKDKLQETYGEKKAKEWIELLGKVSVLIATCYNPALKSKLQKEKKEVEAKLAKVRNNQQFVLEMTQEKKRLTNEIKQMDETLNHKERLQEEYEKRNEFLALEEKIFSVRILSQIMIKEREEKIRRLEKVNLLLNPQKFIEFKQKLESKEKYLVLLEETDLEQEILTTILALQKVFLACYLIKINQVENKQELLSLIYQFRYYCLIPLKEGKAIHTIQELQKEIEAVQVALIQKAHEIKLIEVIAKEEAIDFEILKQIFQIRIINLEELWIKVIKEKENAYYLQLFDGEVLEEEIEIEGMLGKNKKEVLLKLNKKIKIFN